MSDRIGKRRRPADGTGTAQTPETPTEVITRSDLMLFAVLIVWQILNMINMAVILSDWQGWSQESRSSKRWIVMGTFQTIVTVVVCVANARMEYKSRLGRPETRLTYLGLMARSFNRFGGHLPTRCRRYNAPRLKDTGYTIAAPNRSHVVTSRGKVTTSSTTESTDIGTREGLGTGQFLPTNPDHGIPSPLPINACRADPWLKVVVSLAGDLSNPRSSSNNAPASLLGFWSARGSLYTFWGPIRPRASPPPSSLYKDSLVPLTRDDLLQCLELQPSRRDWLAFVPEPANSLHDSGRVEQRHIVLIYRVIRRYVVIPPDRTEAVCELYGPTPLDASHHLVAAKALAIGWRMKNKPTNAPDDLVLLSMPCPEWQNNNDDGIFCVAIVASLLRNRHVDADTDPRELREQYGQETTQRNLQSRAYNTTGYTSSATSKRSHPVLKEPGDAPGPGAVDEPDGRSTTAQDLSVADSYLRINSLSELENNPFTRTICLLEQWRSAVPNWPALDHELRARTEAQIRKGSRGKEGGEAADPGDSTRRLSSLIVVGPR
ncbi:hypothetical protein NM208_g1001 [Fusarium decemcellulare]|uniref:Uncharacterized protein n=1 Tax=Fusarium decemcellulare TaxID=57161 RepID=A0ACC1SXX0_9HYPO|nr:hypothetical protein NM208_g1001 [Fusarium decemcellulare]